MITPLGHRLLVLPDTIEEVDSVYAAAKKLGIKLSETTERQEQTAINKGTVINLGSTAFKDFGGIPWVVVGDRIVFSKYGGFYVKDPEDNKNYLILNDEDAIAKIG